MIRTLVPTIIIEGVIVFAYSRFTKKPTGMLLRANLVVNVITQAVLWIALGFFYRSYLTALLAAEIFIWLVESFLMFRLSNGQLEMKSAVGLSFCMNAASFGLGWYLPV